MRCFTAWKEPTGTPEGVAAHDLILRDLERAVGATDLLEADQHGRAVEQRFGLGEAVVRIARIPAGAPSKLSFACPRLGSKDCSGVRVTPGPSRSTSTITSRPWASCSERDGEAGDPTVEHGPLFAAEFPILQLEFDARRLEVARAFEERRRADHVASDQPGQVGLLLCVAAEAQDGFAREVDGRGERDGRERAADLLRDQHQFEIAHARAAVLFRDGGTEPAHFGGALPDLGVVGASGFQDLAADVEPGMLLEVVAGGLLDEL